MRHIRRPPKAISSPRGYLADLTLRTPTPLSTPLVAPISTVLFTRKNPTEEQRQGDGPLPEKNFPGKGTHWVDAMVKGSVVIVKQPTGQPNAVVGGIMGVRMGVLGCRGVLVDGRVRDVGELATAGLPIWSKGISTVGSGAAASPHAHQVPIVVGGVEIKPGDIFVGDSDNGIVVIPQEKLPDVIRLLPILTAADEKVLDAVRNGMTVFEAFEKFRNQVM